MSPIGTPFSLSLSSTLLPSRPAPSRPQPDAPLLQVFGEPLVRCFLSSTWKLRAGALNKMSLECDKGSYGLNLADPNDARDGA